MSSFFGSAQDLLTALDGSLKDDPYEYEPDFSEDEESGDYSDGGNRESEKNGFSTIKKSDVQKVLFSKPWVKEEEEGNPNECSICLEENETDFIQLPCRHRFCIECVKTYLVLKINENDVPLRHRMVCLRREGPAISVLFNTRLGVVCPHQSCSRVIEQPQIQSIVDPHTYTKFDHNLLLQTVYQMSDIVPCNYGCGSFLQEDCLCTNAACKEKQLKIREKEFKRRQISNNILENRFKTWAKKSSVKCCPKCFNHIEKNGGCDHMFCTRCLTRFNWSEAPSFSLLAWVPPTTPTKKT